MESQKHTPGPWTWSNEYTTIDDRATWTLMGCDGYGIMSCDGNANSPQQLNKANARLIASAPALLAALEITNEALAMMHPDNGDHDGLEYCKCKLAKQWRSARAALAEARS